MNLSTKQIEAIRVAVAEIDGWILKPRLFHNREWKDVPTWVKSKDYEGKPKDFTLCGQRIGGMPPNYPKSLDAVHLVEKRLRYRDDKDSSLFYYDSYLSRVIIKFDQDTFWNPDQTPDTKIWHATALQRCIALIQTLKPEAWQTILNMETPQ